MHNRLLLRHKRMQPAYHAGGKTEVKGNLCVFKGAISLTSAQLHPPTQKENPKRVTPLHSTPGFSFIVPMIQSTTMDEKGNPGFDQVEIEHSPARCPNAHFELLL